MSRTDSQKGLGPIFNKPPQFCEMQQISPQNLRNFLLPLEVSVLNTKLKIGYSRFCASNLLITNVDHIVQILRF